MFGIVNVDKPTGLTSRDVVNHFQRLLRPIKVGHAGTLDPLADGVLIVTVGAATRLTQYIQRLPKRYRAMFLLGKSSDTEDIQGQVADVLGGSRPAVDEIEAVLPRFVGNIMQRPPAFSAIKVRGKRAYQLARQGQVMELEARSVRIDELTIEAYDYPTLTLSITCGSGTYVRSLGRDIARQLGTEAVMSALTRTAIGHLTRAQAVGPEVVTERTLPDYLLSPLEAVRTIKQIEVNEDERLRLATGQTIVRSECKATELVAVSSDGRLLALLGQRSPGQFGPTRNFISR